MVLKTNNYRIEFNGCICCRSNAYNAIYVNENQYCVAYSDTTAKLCNYNDSIMISEIISLKKNDKLSFYSSKLATHPGRKYIWVSIFKL